MLARNVAEIGGKQNYRQTTMNAFVLVQLEQSVPWIVQVNFFKELR